MDKPSIKTMTDEDLTALHKQASEELERRRPKLDINDLVPGKITPEQEQAALAEIHRVVRGL
jgi:hypothetical protein